MISKQTLIGVLLLAIVYLVGIIAVIRGYGNEIMTLTSANLIFATLVFIANAQKVGRRYFIGFAVAFLTGFIVEVIGVHTGVLFGEYSYGNLLGFKIAEVPLIIGINWAVLVFASAALVEKFRVSNFTKSILAASIMLGYDFLLEPVAIHFDMWTWTDSTVPLQNYVTWYVIAFLLLWGVFNYVKNLKNKIALPLLTIQVIFFLVIIFYYGLDV